MSVNQIASKLLSRSQRFIRQQRFLRHMLTLAGGAAIGQALVVLVSPLLTRLYTPDDFGRFSLFSTFISFAAIGSGLRYETAIVAASSDTEADHLTLIALGFTLLTTIITGVIGYLFIAADLLGFGSLPTWAALLTIPSTALVAGFTTVRYWFVRRGMFKIISRATIEQNAARAIIPTLLGLLPTGWIGLAVGEIVARGFGLREMLYQCWKPLRIGLSSLNTTTIINILRKHRDFPLYMLPSSVINSVALLLPLPLIAHLYDVKAAGFFGLVQRLMAVPLSLVAASAADVFHSHIAEYQRSNVAAMRGLFIRTALGLFLTGLGPALVLMLFGPWLFEVIFGSQWREAGVLAAVMTPMVLAQLVVSPISRVVLVTGGQRTKLIYDLISLGSIGLVGYIAYTRQLVLVETVTLLSVSSVLVYVLYFLILLKTIHRTDALPPVDHKAAPQ